MSYGWSAFAAVLPFSGGAVVVLLLLTFIGAKVLGRHNVIDVAWGLLFCGVAVAAFIGSGGHGDPLRRVLLLILPLLWGLRLAVHIGRRSRGKGEDPRYARLLSRARGNPDLYALRSIYLLQGLLAFVVAAPVSVGAFEPGPVGALAWVGVVLWGIGIFFEAVGDSQLERWRKDPAHHGHVIDVGLWRYTRHPNYFGDACVWWGIFLVAADAWPGVITVFAPLLMTALLTRGSGVRIMERHMAGRVGWDDYVARTSRFVPLPVRRRR